MYKEQLRELCLFNLYRKMLRGDHILNYLKTEPGLLENAQQKYKRQLMQTEAREIQIR